MPLQPLERLRSLSGSTVAPLPFATRIRAWRHGFSGWSWLSYDLDHNDWRAYLPDEANARAQKIDGPVARSVLRNKLLFETVVGQHVRVPRIHAAIERGRITPLAEEFDVADPAKLVHWCREYGGVVIKPVDAAEGRQVVSLEVVDGEIRLDKRVVTDEAAARQVASSDGCIVTEMIRQGSFGHAIFSDAVNTLRVVTMTDVDTGEPFVAVAIHRFGTAKSAPTDNVSRGGLRSGVDLETGELTFASASWTHQRGVGFVDHHTHPDSGTHITGTRVPRWDEVKATLVRLVQRFPMMLYVGWDVVVTDDDIVVIEGNHSPNLATQMYRPYLGDPRIARFFRHHGVV
ncbi:MAG: sugar-transfer associated ATP-grasp domain-containing protein [Trueperaceae bacterium]